MINDRQANILALTRRGWPTSHRPPALVDRTYSYALGDDFGPVWSRVLQGGADFALILDEAVRFDQAALTVLMRILAANPGLAGITLRTDALQTIYGDSGTAQSARRFPWSVAPLTALPSWLALLRVEKWSEETRWRTPEFFLLDGTDRKVVQTFRPSAELDAVAWAGRLLSSSIASLAADYGEFALRDQVPPQFRITTPGHTGVTTSGEAKPAHFSVIIPSIRPDFLREAVQSVVDQTYPHWEIRIGIDGPKPIQRKRIADILEEFISDRRVHVRFHDHIGTGPMRKLLAEQSRGSHIIALDDDDRLPPHALQRFARTIAETPGVAILRGGTRVFGLLDFSIKPRVRYVVNGIPNDLFEVTQPYVVRRDVLVALGGFEWDPGLKNAGEDSDLLLKADRQGLSIALIDEPLYERRLSTLNQTLDCTSDECLRHIRYLYDKHDPSGWSLNDVRLTGPGPMLEMWSRHRPGQGAHEVVCSTRFFDFQQVGTRAGVIVDLEVTSLCNATCSFCPREHLDRTRQFVSLETVRALAHQLSREPGSTVVLCGIGESTLHPELLEIVRILAAGRVNVCMTTNGSRLSPRLVDELVSKGLAELNISLNAATAETHFEVMQLRGYEEIARTCREIVGLRPQRWPNLKLHISFVLTAQNQHEAGPFIDQWDVDGVTRLWFHPLTNRAGLLAADCKPGNLGDLATRIAAHPRVVVDLFPDREGPANMCHVARGVDFISADGEMLLCAQDYSARHRFGNLSDRPLSELHRHKLIEHLRGTTSEVCSSCSFCPRGFVNGRDPSYTIVQAGAS